MKDNGNRKLPFDRERLDAYIDRTGADVGLDLTDYKAKVARTIEARPTWKVERMIEELIAEAQGRIEINEPEWDNLSLRLYLKALYKQAQRNRFYISTSGYGDYKGLQHSLVQHGVYSPAIIEKYSPEEMNEAGNLIDPSKDLLFSYNGLRLLATRYLATDKNGDVYELPQERWLTIALYLMQDEKENRMHKVEEAYWALSNLFMTVATPTLSNAGKMHGQLSSCFIDTVDDSLQGIYDSNTDVARVSKHGGGVGTYMGFVRSAGSSIRGVKGASGGVIPWIKQLDNTATSVDQLGTRAGAINVTLDIFHKDIEAFLDLRLNNGDQRQRAHDIFTSVSVPDLFMEKLKSRSEWFLFDPHEVKEKKGWNLQDFYDEEKGEGTFRDRYSELVADGEISKIAVSARSIADRIITSQIETGVPFMFYRDTVNRMNPNSHAGMIYSSNLCMEILQNQSPTVVTEEIIEDGRILIEKEAGDFVVCNLSSINLGKIGMLDVDVMKRLIDVQVRMLDNVIDLNTLPVPQATITNQKYRSIGLGTFGWHHLLARKQIMWESQEAVDLADTLWETINFLTIHASMSLAAEKGAYSLFEGSDWQTGEYFKKRDYVSEDWQELASQVKAVGLRNAYLVAIAPNMSTAQIANSTASIDPIFENFYYEEKKEGRRPIVAPDLDYRTYAYYEKSAVKQDQNASLRQNAARQRHVDQAISFNFYVPSAIDKARILQLHYTAWNLGIKTTYYVRSNDISIQECEWCSA